MTMCNRQLQDNFMTTSSQQMALNATKNKNWRANYLRALNIFTPDVKCSQCGPNESNRDQCATANGRLTTDERSCRLDSHNKDRGRSVVSVSSSAWQNSKLRPSSKSKRNTTPLKDKTTSCMLGMRSHLFRQRMVAPKNELVGRDRVSAPIEIPTGSPTASSCHGSQLVESRKSHDLQESDDPTQSTMQLFSWEEPSVMLGNGCWPLESDKRICTKGVGLNRNEGRRWVSRLFSNSDDIVENREDADFEGSTIAEDDDDIFKMEVDEGSNSTARRSVFRDNRTTNTKRRGDIRPHRPGILDGLDGNNGVMPLSASFVPPHQMVQRGCFSLGLRDQLKRKPGVQI